MKYSKILTHFTFKPRYFYVPNAFLMVKPTDFDFNRQSAIDNEFMNEVDLDSQMVRSKVMVEHDLQISSEKEYKFCRCVQTLKEHGVKTIVIDKNQYEELQDVDIPDGVFPDHITTWENGEVTSYPMHTESREKERLLFPYMIEQLRAQGFKVGNITDIKKNDGGALEAKGGLIMDRRNRQVFASISQRVEEKMVLKWADLYKYKPIVFKSYSASGRIVYHTDIVLSIGDKFALVCEEAIEPAKRKQVLDALSDRELIKISMEQALRGFVCNAAEVRALNSKATKNVFIMSQGAVNYLTDDQKRRISQYVNLVPFPIDLIEKVGGGSARCIIAEIFNPLQE